MLSPCSYKVTGLHFFLVIVICSIKDPVPRSTPSGQENNKYRQESLWGPGQQRRTGAHFRGLQHRSLRQEEDDTSCAELRCAHGRVFSLEEKCMYRGRKRSIHGMTWQGEDRPTCSSGLSMGRNPDTLPGDIPQGSRRLSMAHRELCCGESNLCDPLPITTTIIKQSKIEIRRKHLISLSFA